MAPQHVVHQCAGLIGVDPVAELAEEHFALWMIRVSMMWVGKDGCRTDGTRREGRDGGGREESGKAYSVFLLWRWSNDGDNVDFLW